MSYRFEKESARPVLRSPQGDLVFVRVHVDPRSLEDALEALCDLDFPINPEIRHGYPDTVIEFPAYDALIPEIEGLLRRSGIEGIDVEQAAIMRAMA
jgi:hypothetical protein